MPTTMQRMEALKPTTFKCRPEILADVKDVATFFEIDIAEAMGAALLSLVAMPASEQALVAEAYALAIMRAKRGGSLRDAYRQAIAQLRQMPPSTEEKAAGVAEAIEKGKPKGKDHRGQAQG